MIPKELYEPMEKDITDLLSYEQRWFFINGVRATGKTYSVLKILMKHCLKNPGKEIGYILRTKDEYEDGGTMDGFSKVLMNEFPDYEFEDIKHDIYVKIDGQQYRIVKGFPLSQAFKLKRKAFPTVKFLVFDEYMLEPGTLAKYINGYKEPDLLLNLYETIDRRSNTVKVFLLGNNTQYYNPYHIHPAFKECFLRKPEKGEKNKSKNTVFWRITPTPELAKALKENGFAQMIENSDYGNFASEGEYQDDIVGVQKMLPGCNLLFGLKYSGTYIYVHSGIINLDRYLWLSMKGSPSTQVFAVRGNDIEQNIQSFKNSTWYEVFKTYYDAGRVLFSDQQSKTQCQEFLYFLLSNYRKA